MTDFFNTFILDFLQKLLNYLPNFFSGLIIFVIGLLLGGILKQVLLSLLSFFRIADLFQKTKLVGRNEVKVWEEILAEVSKWTVVVLFLIPTLEVWGLSRATVVINQLLFYLPNVIAAVIIGFVGLVAGNLASQVVKSSFKTIGATSAATLAVFTRSVILFFTVLVVLNQLGVAQDLIRILVTGIVAMLAIAGGLAFGLGGQGVAKEILEELKNKFK